MKPFFKVLSILVFLLSLFTIPAFPSGSVGLTYSAAGGNTDIGALGSYKRAIWRGELDTDGQLAWGAGVDANAHASYTFDLYKNLGIRPFLSFTGKGTSLDTVGGNFDAGLAGNLSIGDAEVGLGAFGRASAEFAPTRRDELLAAGVDGVTPEMLMDPGLDAPATDGLPILRPDTPVHLTAYTGFERGRFDVKFRWLGEASFDTPINQFLLKIGSSYETIFGEIGFQWGFVVQAHDGNLTEEFNASLAWMKRW